MYTNLIKLQTVFTRQFNCYFWSLRIYICLEQLFFPESHLNPRGGISNFREVASDFQAYVKIISTMNEFTKFCSFYLSVLGYLFTIGYLVD